MKKLTLTIGIPAHNESSNITQLLDEIFAQELHLVRLTEVIIVSDGSTDKTDEVVRNYSRGKVTLVKNITNRGVAEAQNQIIKKTNTDVLVLLNADIAIPTKRVLDHLVSPILFGSAWLSAGQIIEQKPQTYVEYGLFGSMCLKRELFRGMGEGNSVYSCVGPIRAFSRKFYRQLRFISNEGEDMYSYLRCKQLQGKFIAVPHAIVRYKLPSSKSDYQKQSDRFALAIGKMKQEFGDEMVKREFAIRFQDYAFVLLRSLPFILWYLPNLIVYSYLVLRTRFYRIETKNESTWGVQSTKVLQRVSV